MDGREAAAMLGVVQGLWRAEWTEQQEDIWLFEFHSYEFEDMRAGARELAKTLKRTPSFADLVEAAAAKAVERRRRDDERKAIRARAGLPERPSAWPEIQRMWRAKTRASRDLGEHNHRGEPGCSPHERYLTCPICSKHDHTDQRIVGWAAHHLRGSVPNGDGQLIDAVHWEPILATHWTCPRCGDPEAAALLIDIWSPECAAEFRPDGDTRPIVNAGYDGRF